MKVLHLIKTPFGARWALQQVCVLRRLGVEITILLPPGNSQTAPLYEAAGCKVIRFDFHQYQNWPPALYKTVKDLRIIFDSELPDIVHSHFFETTVLMRLALRDNSSMPRVFQVAGPLHLERWPFSNIETGLSGKMDYWIGSSQCVVDHYLRKGIPKDRLFLSYYGYEMDKGSIKKKGILHEILDIEDDEIVVGNVGWMYAPKYYLGHVKGIKRHEDIIDALPVLMKRMPSIRGVFVGGAWNSADWYEDRLIRRAQQVAGDRISFAGPLSYDEASKAWSDYDLAIHVPISENCGGVAEALYFAVPTLASDVGGIPEVIIEGKTGYLIPPNNQKALVDRTEEILSDYERAKRVAAIGSKLVRTMFDVNRTAREIYSIYMHILDTNKPRPEEFDSIGMVKTLEP